MKDDSSPSSPVVSKLFSTSSSTTQNQEEQRRLLAAAAQCRRQYQRQERQWRQVAEEQQQQQQRRCTEKDSRNSDSNSNIVHSRRSNNINNTSSEFDRPTNQRLLLLGVAAASLFSVAVLSSSPTSAYSRHHNHNLRLSTSSSSPWNDDGQPPLRFLQQDDANLTSTTSSYGSCNKTCCDAYWEQECSAPAANPFEDVPFGVQIFLIIILICLSALFSGLTLGLMSLDMTGLEIVMEGDDRKNAEYARRIYPIRKNGNLLLCTLLLGNVAVNALLSILLADKAGGIVGFLASTFLIVIFGEILPQGE